MPVPDLEADSGRGGFQPTRWTVVMRARGQTPEARGALSDLCEAYYHPVFRFLRREGHDEERAHELTHEFFAHLLAKGSLGAVDPGRGRFRSYLLGAVGHFVADRRRHDRRQKRGGKVEWVEWTGGEDAEGNSVEACPDLSMGQAQFDRDWAFTLMKRALARLERECGEAGRAEQFGRLKPWLVGEAEGLPRAAAAQGLGMTETALKVAIHRLRVRFRAVMHEEIAQTLDREDTVQDELRYLIQVLSQEG